MSRGIGPGSPIAVALRPRCEHRVSSTLTRVFCTAAVVFAATATSAAAAGGAQGPPAGPKSPPFTQCPPIGIDSGCEYLIDVTSTNPAIAPTVVRDPNQPFFDGEDDVTVAVQNDTAVKLEKIHIGVSGSGDRLFAFDGDGICWSGISPRPSECPFESNTYAGPDTALRAESEDAGTVVFPTPLKPGQHTYFALEAPPTTALVAGAVNDTIFTTLTNGLTHETGVALASPAPLPVTDRATIKGPHGAEATGTVEYLVYSDPSCAKLVASMGTKNVSAGVAESSDPSSAQLPTNATYFWLVKYSGDVNNSPTTSGCGSETMTFGAPPVSVTSLGHTAGPLKVLALRLNEKNGQITVTAQLPSGGILTADAVIKQGASIARATPVGDTAAAKKCKRGYVRRHGRCINNAAVVYGIGARNVGSAGSYSLTIKPTRRVLAALRKGRKPFVTVYVSLEPLPSGAQLNAVRTLVARIKQPKHH
jgi:hypothetical protein